MAFLASLLPALIGGGLEVYKTVTSGSGGGDSGPMYGPPNLTGMTFRKRRRKRNKLTHSQMMELANIKSILGRTAAANALPYYLGK